MTLVALAIRHARAVSFIAVVLAIAGAVAAQLLPSSIYPPLEFPRIVVIAHSGTVPSRSMMLTVTRPVEQALMEVPGILRVRSTSLRGAAEISAQFEPATDMVVALQQAQNRISEVRSELPAETDLTVERLTPAVFPVIILSLTGALPTPELDDYARYAIRPALSRVPGAGRIEVLASDTREIEVILDPARLAAAGLSASDVAAALRAQNQLQPVGRLVEAGQQHLALASGLWASVDDVARAPLIVKDGATVRVADVGQVVPGSPDRTLLITGNGQNAVSVSISQQVGANVIAVRDGIEQVVRDLARSLPAGLRVTKVYDLAEFVSASIANVRDAILLGGVLAVLVLMGFLRQWRLTAVAAVTLPLAVLPTFLFLRLFGGSINLMSMGGLAVAIGLVIDDAVVVVENIHRHAEGHGDVAASVGELMAPLVSSTLTTVVVFAPLGLLSGVTGQFFRALSLSLSVAVLLSLALSVSVVPLLARVAVRGTIRARARRGKQGGDAAPPTADRLGRGYARILAPVLRRPMLALALALVLAAVSAASFVAIGTGFLPPADEGGFVVDYLTPAGSALSETDRQVRALEQVLAKTPEVAAYSRRTGSELGLFATPQNSGDILVRLKPRRERTRSADAIIADLRPRLHEAAPLVDIEFVQLLQDMLGDLEGNPTPIEVKVFGDDHAVLAAKADEIQAIVEKVPGIVDVVGVKRGNPEVSWEVDPVAAMRLGLTVEQVGAQLSAAWLGEVATDLRLLDRRIPVRVRLADAFRLDPAQVPGTLVRTGSGGLVPVSALAHPVPSNGEAELLRENLRGMALVSARLEGRDLGSAVADLRERLRAVRLPVGYALEIGGQYGSQQQAFRELLTVCGLALVLVFTILLVQFRAVMPAVLVLAAAPLSLCGALLLLLATGTDLNVSSAMGLILLVGLVVKNGIMLLDYTARRLESGEPLEAALAQTGRIRLRPILMTTGCTLFGLAPLALGLGSGAELQRPLALAVIGGLALSTPVTLLVVPGLYAAVRRRARPEAAR